METGKGSLVSLGKFLEFGWWQAPAGFGGRLWICAARIAGRAKDFLEQCSG